MSTPLREIGRVDHSPQTSIEEAMKGVTFDYYFNGERKGQNGQIELSVTSIVKDWENNIYYRTCRYLGHGKDWKRCIRLQIISHLSDLGVGILLVRALTGHFIADKNKFKKLEEKE